MINKKVRELLNDLRMDNRSGANQLIKKAIEIIKNQLNSIKNENEDISKIFIDLSKRIIDSRPSMAPLINTIGYIVTDLELFTKKDILRRIELFYSKKIEIESALERAFRTFLAKNTKENLKIMLISYSSTIVNLLTQFKELDIELFVLESRPLLEGHRTAEILSSLFKTHLIIDAAMGKYIEQVDLVFIGIDSILKDGSIVNKIGTFPLAIIAYTNQVDVYAIGDSLKYNLKSHFGQDIIIERKPITEVYNRKILNKELKIHNYYFDITPPKYISGIISDLGVLTVQKFLTEVKNVVPINWFQFYLRKND